MAERLRIDAIMQNSFNRFFLAHFIPGRATADRRECIGELHAPLSEAVQVGCADGAIAKDASLMAGIVG